jgi:hypothetical protein
MSNRPTSPTNPLADRFATLNMSTTSVNRDTDRTFGGGNDHVRVDPFYRDRTKLGAFLVQLKMAFKLTPTGSDTQDK